MMLTFNTAMILDKYELLELIADDEERKSFNARDISSSRKVIVHALRSPSKLSPAKPDLAELAKSLFLSGGVPELLFAGEREGTFYIVSEPRFECLDVRKWLEQVSMVESKLVSSDDALGKAGILKVPPGTAPSSSEPGEFTRMFSTAPDPPAAAPELPSRAAPASPTPPTGPEPGEFTRMFQPGRSSESKPPADPEPGQFTRLFQTPSSPPHPAVEYLEYSPARATPAEPGEFTRLFATPPAQDAQEKKGALPYNVEPVASSGQPATASLFDKPPVAARQNPAMASARQPNKEAATGIFRSPVPVEPPIVQEPTGPSEFTRVVALPTRPPEQAPVTTAPSQSPNTAPPSSRNTPTAAPSYLPLVLMLNGLFVAAVLLILYFALKK